MRKLSGAIREGAAHARMHRPVHVGQRVLTIGTRAHL